MKELFLLQIAKTTISVTHLTLIVNLNLIILKAILKIPLLKELLIRLKKSLTTWESLKNIHMKKN